jgi:SAM-dependent methyltransferase
LFQHVSSAWYADFFTELPNEFWRRVVSPEATAAEVDFVEEQLGLAAGSRIVDVPCGSGRHSIALARRGHAVTGLDISTEAIEHARRTAKAAGVDVDFRLAEMRDVPPDGFDAVVCMGNSFGYLDPEGLRTFVAALAAAVRPGGGLVVDYNAAAETILPGFTGEDRTMHAGDITVAATTEYDVAHSCLISGYRFTRGAEEVAVTALHHVLTCAQIGDLLTTAGFVDIAHCAGPEGEPFRLGAPRLLLTARRRT